MTDLQANNATGPSPTDRAVEVFDRVFVVLSPLLVLAMAGNLARAVRLGGWLASAVQIGVVSAVLVLAFAGRRSPAGLRAAAYTTAAVLFATAGLLRWGLASQGLPVLTLALIFASALGYRYWLAICALAFAISVAVAVGWVAGALPLQYDPAIYLRSPLSWALGCLTVIVGAFSVRAWEVLNHELSEANRRLLASEDNYREIFSATSEGLVVLDGQGAIVDANRQAGTMYGQPNRSVRGIHVGVFSHGEPPYGPAEAAQWLRRAVDDGPQVFEWLSRREDGSLFWTEVALRACTIAGQPRFIGAVRDVTERKASEHEREALIKQLERTNAELERFNYTVSHDLKTPLITIRGYLGRLRSTIEDNRTDQAGNCLDRIDQASDHMGHLLDNLLHLSRIGRVVSPPRTAPLSEVVVAAIELLGEHHAQIQIAEPLPKVHADLDRLHEVFQNLLENAVRFTAGRSEPRIEIGCDGPDADSGWPVIRVSDNGAGFRPEYADRIFRLFEQLEPSAGSTGVGLAVVKRIIEIHGGRVWAESAGPDRGACFRFTVPPAPDPVVAA